jgi:hypothetical protein
MDALKKYEMVNACETAEDLANAIKQIANPETGLIQGRNREFDSTRMAGYVSLVIHEGAPANLLTREFGIRQQALYLKYGIDNGI